MYSPRWTARSETWYLRWKALLEGALRDISFEVHAGEILGLTGLVAPDEARPCGRSSGLDKLEKGKMWLNGQEITIKNPKDAIKKGVLHGE